MKLPRRLAYRERADLRDSMRRVSELTEQIPMTAMGHSRLAPTGRRFGHVRCALESGRKIRAIWLRDNELGPPTL
jgi:hypothetical protein